MSSSALDGCPFCGGLDKAFPDSHEYTRKVIDDNDLIKG